MRLGKTSYFYVAGIDPSMGCQGCPSRVAQRAEVDATPDPPHMQHLPRGQRLRQADEPYWQQAG